MSVSSAPGPRDLDTGRSGELASSVASIQHITIEAPEPTAASSYYTDALRLGSRVLVHASESPSTGFRGFVLGLVVAQPAEVDDLLSRAAAAGATVLKPATKSLWGYGGAARGPDGTIVTVASASKKNTASAGHEIDLVLQLGVTDVAAGKRFYADRGFSITKSYGRKYVELDTGAVSLTLNVRGALAKAAGVPADGAGSHRLLITGDAGYFTDPDGYVWAAA